MDSLIGYAFFVKGNRPRGKRPRKDDALMINNSLVPLIVFGLLCFYVGATLLYRAIIEILRAQKRFDRQQSDPSCPPAYLPSEEAFPARAPQRFGRQGINLLALISFALITATAIALLLGYIP